MSSGSGDSLLQFKILYKGATPGAARKHLKRAKAGAYKAAGFLWHKNYRPRHFTVGGAREYHYSPRKGQPGSGQSWWVSYTKKDGTRGRRRSYQNVKQRRGLALPLVWSGNSRDQAKRRDVRSVATAKKSRMRVYVHARTLNRRHPESQVDMHDEMTRISGREHMAMTDKTESVLLDKLQKIRDRKTIRIT